MLKYKKCSIQKMINLKTKYDPIKYKTPTGSTLSCKGWIQEAALRMLLNNLDPEVAERPDDLIVYGGRGKAARNFEALDNIIKAFSIQRKQYRISFCLN